MEGRPKDEKKEIGRLERERDELHKVIGKKEMVIDFLQKLAEVGTVVRVEMISPGHKEHSIKERFTTGHTSAQIRHQGGPLRWLRSRSCPPRTLRTRSILISCTTSS